jgi:hypothetical protein
MVGSIPMESIRFIHFLVIRVVVGINNRYFSLEKRLRNEIV